MFHERGFGITASATSTPVRIATATTTTAATAFPPSPVLMLLRDAATLLGAAAQRLVAELARDYPASLARRPGQLQRAAHATAAELAELVRAAGFADLDDARRQAEHELPDARSRRAVRPAAADDAEPGATLRREQAAFAATLAANSGSTMEHAAGAILGSRRRWVFGDLRSRGYAQLFAAHLTTALGQVVLIDPAASGVLAAVGDAQRRDSLTVFSFHRYSRLAVRVAREFAQRGATVVAVTDDVSGPIAKDAAHVLRVVASGGAHSPTAAVALGHTLATLAATGAKGAARRAEQERAVAAELQWYEDAGS